MEFFKRSFPGRKSFTLYPLGDWHFGSRQCDVSFIKQVVDEIKRNDNAWWVGMGDFMENAIIGSKSDVYTQVMPPREQMEAIVDILMPIKDKGLFLIAGNHEQRSMRVVGIVPETYIATRLDIPYKEFSCYALFELPACKTPFGFSAYLHHNYGGGYTPGGKVNRAEQLRLICPTADAIFSGHFHITSRMPVTWYGVGRKSILKKVGYDYITGSALSWHGSYAEERGKRPSSVEHISVEFIGATCGDRGHYDNGQQIYRVITPKDK